MTTFAELIDNKIQEPLDNFKNSVLKDLKNAKEGLSSNTFMNKAELERIAATEKASYNVLTIYNALMDNMGFNEESSMLFIGTVQAKQRDVDNLKHSKEYKETESDYYTDIITNFYMLISEIGNILGETKRSFGFDYDSSEQEHGHQEHAHSHEESCSCEHCHA